MIKLNIPRSHLKRFTLRSYAPGVYVGNEFITPEPVDKQHLASIQQVKDANLQNLPEGMDPQDTWLLRSSTAIFQQQTKQQLPSEAFFNGKWYTLVMGGDWTGNSHSKGVFSRHDRTRA